jgi:hypothetical protein
MLHERPSEVVLGDADSLSVHLRPSRDVGVPAREWELREAGPLDPCSEGRDEWLLDRERDLSERFSELVEVGAGIIGFIEGFREPTLDEGFIAVGVYMTRGVPLGYALISCSSRRIA